MGGIDCPNGLDCMVKHTLEAARAGEPVLLPGSVLDQLLSVYSSPCVPARALRREMWFSWCAAYQQCVQADFADMYIYIYIYICVVAHVHR